MGGRGPFLQMGQASFQEGDSCVLGLGRLVAQHGCRSWARSPQPCVSPPPPAVIPSLNIAAGLLGFFLLKSLAKGLDWAKAPIKFNPPLTAQEVTVIQVRMGASAHRFTWPVSDITGQQGTRNTAPQLWRRVKPRARMLL